MKGAHGRMPRRQRVAIYLVIGGLWLTGCVWLVLDEFFAKSGSFGPVPNPAEPGVLLVHGMVAIAAMYLMGWVSARHVLRWWPRGLRRLSGTTLAVCLALLVISGFALFFVSEDRWQRGSALLHDALGVGVTVFAIQHWFFARRSTIRNAASRP